MSEFPRHPSKRQKRRQEEISGVISGLQDLRLEVSVEDVPEIIERHEDWLWEKWLEYKGDLDA